MSKKKKDKKLLKYKGEVSIPDLNKDDIDFDFSEEPEEKDNINVKKVSNFKDNKKGKNSLF